VKWRPSGSGSSSGRLERRTTRIPLAVSRTCVEDGRPVASVLVEGDEADAIGVGGGQVGRPVGEPVADDGDLDIGDRGAGDDGVASVEAAPDDALDAGLFR
jgi:hypothetical protein